MTDFAEDVVRRITRLEEEVERLSALEAKISKLYKAGGSDPAVIISSDGEATNSFQPMFLAYNSVTDTNVTGDSTIYTVVCDTVVQDRGSNYNNTTGIFTASIDGIYLFVATILLQSISSTHTRGATRIVTSSRTFIGNYCNPYATKSDNNLRTLHIAALADMEDGHTAYMAVQVGTTGKTVGVYGSGVAYTYFCGGLLA